MIFCHASEGGRLQPAGAALEDALWIDLLCPTPEEEALVETALGIDIPTREEMEEIEISSRLYTEGDVIFVTAMLAANAGGGDPQMGPVSFVLSPEHLVTVRYHEPRVFRAVQPRAIKTGQMVPDAPTAFVVLFDAIVDRAADVLEIAGKEIDKLSRSVFAEAAEKSRPHNYQATLQTIGRMGNLNSNIRDSLLTIERALAFATAQFLHHPVRAGLCERIRSLISDAHALSDHAGFLSAKITFLLDTVLGLINIEQNGTIKIFSVVAVIFLPPTLIASIYGMNFAHMPELTWPWGYPMALGLMVVFAALPYLFFKYRKWL